ncbi:hypothetical protein LJC46_10240, partial [Desulfovibrio sp. OttesenSCG-928-G15]|nr:hypothetical protein [Desulfovibrio sp. OttesenSCG-928-G15]
GGTLNLNGQKFCLPSGDVFIFDEFDDSPHRAPRWCGKPYYKPTPKVASWLSFTWQNGKYILADGIFTEVTARRGNIYRVKRIGHDTIFYLITDGQGRWAHGSTFGEAIKCFEYKYNVTPIPKKYSGVTLDSILPLNEAKEAYHVITGACEYGVRNFVEGLSEVKDQYTVREIIALTQGHYGNEKFARFFENRQ